jgi:hypothetical protein
MVLATLAGSVICDRIGNYYLWSLLGCRGDPLLCNAVIVGRLLFALLVIMELAAIGYVFIAAFGHAGRARRVSPQQFPCLPLACEALLIDQARARSS